MTVETTLQRGFRAARRKTEAAARMIRLFKLEGLEKGIRPSFRRTAAAWRWRILVYEPDDHAG